MLFSTIRGSHSCSVTHTGCFLLDLQTEKLQKSHVVGWLLELLMSLED